MDAPRALPFIGATALALAVVFSPPVEPCTQPCVPGGFGKAVVQSHLAEKDGRGWTVPVCIKGYKTAGGSIGEYCTCGFGGAFTNVAGVKSFDVVYAGTNTSIPGFSDFATQAAVTNEWQSLAGAGKWKAFLAPVFESIPPGTLVDLRFDVIVARPADSIQAESVGPCAFLPGTNGGPCSEPTSNLTLDEALDMLEDELATAMVGTDAATVDGTLLDMHQELATIGDVSIVTGPSYEFLGGGIAGGLGPLTLTGAGTLDPGDDGALHLTGATPVDTAFVVLGLTQIDAPLKGGVLVPNPDIVITALTAGDGSLELPFFGLPDFGTSFTVYAQVWQPDLAAVKKFAASNGLAMFVN